MTAALPHTRWCARWRSGAHTARIPAVRMQTQLSGRHGWAQREKVGRHAHRALLDGRGGTRAFDAPRIPVRVLLLEVACRRRTTRLLRTAPGARPQTPSQRRLKCHKNMNPWLLCETG